MTFYLDLPDLTQLPKPITLAIGNFDGVHSGHLHLIDTMRALSTEKGSVVILSFTNNPREIIEMKHVPTLSSDLNNKESLLHNQSVDKIIFHPFTKKISNTSYIDFITFLRSKIPFKNLVFGEGEALGKNLEGTPKKMILLSEELGFKVHYITKLKNEEKTISSTAIRSLLFQSRFKEANLLLGYNYYITLSKYSSRLDTDLIKPGKYLVKCNNPDQKIMTIEVNSAGMLINTQLKKNVTLEFIKRII